jgi:hypothetical protein
MARKTKKKKLYPALYDYSIKFPKSNLITKNVKEWRRRQNEKSGQ